MAEATSLVPLGRSDTGKAVVLSQNIAESPMAMFKHQQRFKAAQDAAEAKAKAAEQKALDDQRKELALSSNKTHAIYQEDISRQGQQFYNDLASEYKKHNGKLPAEKELEFRRRKAQIEENASYGEKVVANSEKIKQDLLNNPYLNKDEVAKVVGNSYFKEDGTLKYGNEFDFQNLSTTILTDPDKWNSGKLADDFTKSLYTEYSEKFGQRGRFDTRVLRENNLPIKLDANGNWAKNNVTGRYELEVTGALLDEVEKNAHAAAYFDALEERQRAAYKADPSGTPPPSREENVKQWLSSEVATKETTQLLAKPQPRSSGSGKEKKTPFVTPVVNGVAYSQRNKDGQVIDVKAPLLKTINSDTGAQISVELTPSRIYELNPDGDVGRIRNNVNPADITVEHVFVGLVNENGSIMRPPEGVTENTQAFAEWAKGVAGRNQQHSYQVQAFGKGITTDKANISKDDPEYQAAFNEEVKSEGKDKFKLSQADIDRIHQNVLNKLMGVKDASIRGTQKSILFQLDKTNRTKLEGKLKNNKVFTGDEDKFMNDLNSTLRSRQPAKKSNDVLGFGGNKPAATTKKTQGKNNPLGF